MINAGLFTSKKEVWETPTKLFNELNDTYHFTWDLAATKENTKCKQFFSLKDDSLAQDWSKLKGNLFLNPPYGRELAKWVKKAAETKLIADQKLVLLIPSRTDTSYWHDYIFGKAEVDFLRGRLKFEINGESKDAAPFPSALITFGGHPNIMNSFSTCGRKLGDDE